MRADAAAQLRLLDLQALDTVLGQLAHRRRGVPQIAELAALDSRAQELRDHEVAVRTAVSDLEREMAKAEADVAQVRERITRDQALLDAGSVASARQLEDLQHEIGNLARRVSDLEDAELEVMEKLEDAQVRAAAASAAVAELAEARLAAERARDAAFADIDAEVARVSGERARVVQEIPADLLTLYDRIRGDSGGIGAAPLHRGRCQGCQLTLTPADLGRIRAEPVDEVVRCEECRRILVRIAESGL
ncbi:MAG TPA: C4-type zinc ribbon domain-containing protein [Candidatus Limnocylindrales bacterium]|nr:C4-type zinc ribbon domain-containing protein [Candidatus Limnocylindrales bacterium]